MDLGTLIDGLSQPAAYPEPVEAVEVRQTHISVVFLAGRHAYKIKKPVDLGFLDFRTLDSRRHYAGEEVRLNRRLAPGVYLDVVPVVETPTGLRIGGNGEPVEWAVQMVRLPDQATLRALLERDDIGAVELERLARQLAAFHDGAERGPHVDRYGRYDVVRQNLVENLDAARSQRGVTLVPSVEERLASRTLEALEALRPLIETRAERGIPRDTHGDLRLDHVYFLPDRAPPDDLVVIDCIEFNERFRYADPVADVAFLAMDLIAHGRRDLAGVFRDAYLAASGDVEGQPLWPLYISYRSAVRAKVAGVQQADREIPEADRAAAGRRARAHWLLALDALEQPGRRPALVLIGGLPGTGKSTLARRLAECSGFQVIRSDVVRKELAGLTGSDSAAAPYRQGIYSPEWTDRTYAECLARAEAALIEGGRVVVDASFLEDARRHAFLVAADRLGLPALFLQCIAEPGTVRQRLDNRREDPSDADWAVYEQAATRWEPPGARTRRSLALVPTDEPGTDPVEPALEALRRSGLHGEADPWE